MCLIQLSRVFGKDFYVTLHRLMGLIKSRREEGEGFGDGPESRVDFLEKISLDLVEVFIKSVGF